MVLPTRLSATLLRNACSTALIGYGRPAFLRPPFACSRTRPHEFKSLSGSLQLQKNLLYGGFFIVVIPTRFELVLPPWKGDVLTAWPWSRVLSPLGVSNVSDKKTPRVGLEPTTTRLTAECSTIELSRKISCFISDLRECSAFSKSYKAKCEEIIYSFKTEHWNLISYILTSILLSYPKPLVKPSTD